MIKKQILSVYIYICICIYIIYIYIYIFKKYIYIKIYGALALLEVDSVGHCGLTCM